MQAQGGKKNLQDQTLQTDKILPESLLLYGWYPTDPDLFGPDFGVISRPGTIHMH